MAFCRINRHKSIPGQQAHLIAMMRGQYMAVVDPVCIKRPLRKACIYDSRHDGPKISAEFPPSPKPFPAGIGGSGFNPRPEAGRRWPRRPR
jgi:hypothetical protein